MMANTTKDINKNGSIGRSKPLHIRQGGNAMIYVLIALALFGFLTITLSGQNDQADGQDLDDEQAEFYALELMEYVASAQQAVDMMLYTGSSIDDLDFITPNDAAFNTPPHQNKVFHPQGGGLNYFELHDNSPILQPGSGVLPKINLGRFNNFEWTPSAENDVILSFYQINQSICSAINKRITGNTTIPSISAEFKNYFIDDAFHTGTNADFTNAICPVCNSAPQLCINKTATQDAQTFYAIIAAQ